MVSLEFFHPNNEISYANHNAPEGEYWEEKVNENLDYNLEKVQKFTLAKGWIALI